MVYYLYMGFLLASLLWAILVTIVITSAFIGFLLTRVPFVPTSGEDIELMVKKLPIRKQDIFFDLGSGDGKVIFIVEKLSGARVKGFELTWWTHVLAKIKRLLTGSQAELSNKNFFHQDWSEATIIYAYLYPPLMKRVEEKFKAECKPGSIAVVRDFAFPTMEASETWYINKSEQAVSHSSNRWILLLKSLWPNSKPKSHELYIYRI